jgi:large subunit ribosomal protein L24
MGKMKLKTGDYVRIMSGTDKGQEGKIVKMFLAKERAIVEGKNMVSKHRKPSANNPQGGIEKIEASIHISNLMLVEDGKVVRAGFKIEDGKKVRVSKKSGKAI